MFEIVGIILRTISRSDDELPELLIGDFESVYVEVRERERLFRNLDHSSQTFFDAWEVDGSGVDEPFESCLGGPIYEEARRYFDHVTSRFFSFDRF